MEQKERVKVVEDFKENYQIKREARGYIYMNLRGLVIG